MRSGIALVVSTAALVVLLTASGSRATPRPTPLYPNAVAFSDATHGALGTGYPYGGNPGGTIQLTSDGGRTWRIALRTPRPVVKLAVEGRDWYAQFDDGETLRSSDAGTHWAPTTDSVWPAGVSSCPIGLIAGTHATPGDWTWSVCTTSGGAGAEGKAVYRQRQRVACTNFADLGLCGRHSYGGISAEGYPVGIAGNASGVGVIWESRGTLYVTSDGGRHWRGLAHLVRFDVDYGSWATVLPRGGVGFALIRHAAVTTRLLETTDAGRTWRVVHRWS